MSAASTRFYPRAPRYTLKASDDNQMRFALMQTRGSSLETELRDVSKSGLKFTIFNTEVPRRGLDEGDVIKIEFKVPQSGKQIACFATVTRVEQVEEWHPQFGDQSHTEVAVQFRHLPSAFASILEKATPQKESIIRAEEAIHVVDVTPNSQVRPEMNKQALLMFSLSSVALFSLFMFLSVPPQQWLNWLTR